MQRFIAVILLTIFTTTRIINAEAVMPNICPNGRTSVSPYANGLCPAGSTRTPVGNAQLCCGSKATSAVISCVPGSQIGACLMNDCPQPFVCETFSQTCCISTTAIPSGPCLLGICPSGFTCFNGSCYETGTPETGNDPCTAICPNLESTGPCLSNNNCPAGQFCINNGEVCCGSVALKMAALARSGLH